MGEAAPNTFVMAVFIAFDGSVVAFGGGGGGDGDGDIGAAPSCALSSSISVFNGSSCSAGTPSSCRPRRMSSSFWSFAEGGGSDGAGGGGSCALSSRSCSFTSSS